MIRITCNIVNRDGSTPFIPTDEGLVLLYMCCEGYNEIVRVYQR